MTSSCIHAGEAKPIKLSKPEPAGGTHQLLQVFGVDGGKGDDTLIAPVLNDASALLEGKGADLLVGSDGSDLLDGGDENDTLHGDGSHNEANAAATGQDIVRGGEGNDSVYTRHRRTLQKSLHRQS